MAPEDLIRIVLQPSGGFFPDLVGSVGVVMEVNGGFIDVRVIGLDGSVKGGGWIASDCVGSEDRPEWVKAKEAWLENQRRLEKEILSTNDRVNKCAAELAAKHGITPEAVKEIHSQMGLVTLG